MTAIPQMRASESGWLDRDAVRDALPILLGLAPFGVLIGVTIDQFAFDPAVGLVSAALLVGGTAHLTALTLLATGAAPLAVIAAVIIINARLMLYGAALYPRFRGQPRWFRWLAPHLLFDQTYAIAMARRELAGPARFRRYWLTAGGLILVGWMSAHVVGLLLGSVLPARSALDIAAPAVFVALLAPQLARRAAVIAASTAALVAAAASALPSGLGLICGALAGIVAAAATDRRPQS